MSEVRTYRDLVVWQKGMDIVTKIYDLTRDFPASEIYGLTSQIRRCAVSVPSNMAEGYGRRSTQEYIRFLQIASGSLFELQTQLQISINLNYISNQKFAEMDNLISEIDRMLSSLINAIKNSST